MHTFFMSFIIFFIMYFNLVVYVATFLVYIIEKVNCYYLHSEYSNKKLYFHHSGRNVHFNLLFFFF